MGGWADGSRRLIHRCLLGRMAIEKKSLRGVLRALPFDMRACESVRVCVRETIGRFRCRHHQDGSDGYILRREKKRPCVLVDGSPVNPGSHGPAHAVPHDGHGRASRVDTLTT